MLEFFKYQGTGNDFVLIDNRESNFKNDTKTVKLLCDRKFGIGADGLILLQQPKQPTDDFEMVYFNADGNQSSMCGNGGRCLVHFAHSLKIFENACEFTAVDGKHSAHFKGNEIALKMSDVKKIQKSEDHLFLDTGSPHHIEFVDSLDTFDVAIKGTALRNSSTYREKGVNVNFVELQKNGISVRTFERGVEGETLSCGTGVTAAAIATHAAGKTNKTEIAVKTLGGNLSVRFSKQGGGYSEVELIGPATPVFKGII